jgi:hypothetical protein
MKRLSLTKCVRKKCRGINARRTRKKIKSRGRTLLRVMRKNIMYLRRKTNKVFEKVLANEATDEDEKEFEDLKAELKNHEAMYGQSILSRNRDESKRTAKRDTFYLMKQCVNDCDPKRKKEVPQTPQEVADDLKKLGDPYWDKISNMITENVKKGVY